MKAECRGGGYQNSQAFREYRVWTRIASTNSLERVNREIKRRNDVVGIVPNEDAIIRLVGAIMLETNDEWTVACRYINLETLAHVKDNPDVKLLAMTS